MSITYCIDPRCTTSQRCWRDANERYGNAPGENYGPRCIPAPPSVGQTYEQGIAEGERRERAPVVAWLRSDEPHRLWADSIGGSEYTCAAEAIERGEHRREEEE
jgi:hypothetical protein